MLVKSSLTERIASRAFPNVYSPRYNLILPFYHNIGDINPSHTRHLYDIPGVHKFTEDIDFLCSHYVPVGLDEAIRAAETAESLPKRSFHLTFDDGFRELYDTVAPILLDKGVPATFLVCSAATDNKFLLATNIASLVIEAAEKTGKLPPEYVGHSIAGFGDKLRALSRKGAAAMEALVAFYEIDLDDFLKTRQPYLTSAQIKELAGQGFSIGSHSHSHLPFQEISTEVARDEISKSVSFIRDDLQLRCESFAYPYFDANVARDNFDALADNGIRISFGTAAPKWDSVPFSLQRFPMAARFSHRPIGDTLRYLSARAFANRLLGRKMIDRPAV